MVQNLATKNANIGAEERIRDNDLISATVSNQRWTGIFETQSGRSVKYAPGHGVNNRQGNAGFGDLDLKDSNGNAINGKLRWEVYQDSNKDDLIGVSSTRRSENLRAAVNDDRTDKPMFPLLEPGAPNEGYLVLAFKADPLFGGVDIDPNSCNVNIGIPYSRFQA